MTLEDIEKHYDRFVAGNAQSIDKQSCIMFVNYMLNRQKVETDALQKDEVLK